MIVKSALLALFLLGGTGIDTASLAQARANYEAVMSGRKPLNQLTQRELADLRAFVDLLERQKKTGTPSERCFAEELKKVGGSPSDLDQRIIDLKCRELGGR